VRRLLRGPLLLSLALLAGAVAGLAPARAEDAAPRKLPAWKKGVHEGRVSIDGKEEAFTVLVPAGYTPKKTWPAVLLLHGNGGKAADFLQHVKSHVGKAPLLLVSLERCDNGQDAVGYASKYLEGLRAQLSLADGRLFALGFSGGGFRLWDDVVGKPEEATKFRGVVLVGSARQSFDPGEKPSPAPTVILVGDPRDPNFTESGPAAEKALAEKGYETIVLEHSAGHSMPAAEMKEVFAWIDAVVSGKKTTLATRRVGEKPGAKR
jgi:predicted esterase